jgi:hypothetical protein
MRSCDIHASVEGLLGRTVPASSVKNWLAKSIRDDDPPVRRVARGLYRAGTRGSKATG